MLNDNTFTLIRGASRVSREAVLVEKSLRAAGNPTILPFPLNPRTTLGNQLEQVGDHDNGAPGIDASEGLQYTAGPAAR